MLKDDSNVKLCLLGLNNTSRRIIFGHVKSPVGDVDVLLVT